MALGTIGTAATTTLHSIVGGLAGTGTAHWTDVNVAILNNAIKNDLTGNLARGGTITGFDGQLVGDTSAGGALLYIPRRGVLRVFAGDYVAYDSATGWPILVSAAAAAGAGWVHS